MTPSVGCVGQVASLVDGSWDENSKRLQAAVAAVQSQTLAKVPGAAGVRLMRGVFDEGGGGVVEGHRRAVVAAEWRRPAGTRAHIFLQLPHPAP